MRRDESEESYRRYDTDSVGSGIYVEEESQPESCPQHECERLSREVIFHVPVEREESQRCGRSPSGGDPPRYREKEKSYRAREDGWKEPR